MGFFTKTTLRGIGTIWIAKNDSGICRVSFGGNRNDFLRSLPLGIEWTCDEKRFKGLISKLKRMSQGGRVSFSERLELGDGTEFQKRVWKRIAKIPWGETASYRDLARAIGRPKAYRAVANACGANPIPIIIPCHRVIASDGTIGGFSSGVELKRRLLKLEQ